jgi:hypothetical protein
LCDAGNIQLYFDHVIKIWKSLAHQDGDISNNWSVGPDKELLLYIPVQHKIALYSPRNSLVIAKGATKLDIFDTAGGIDWKVCHSQNGTL